MVVVFKIQSKVSGDILKAMHNLICKLDKEMNETKSLVGSQCQKQKGAIRWRYR